MKGGYDPSVFTLSSLFPFLEGKSANYPALWFLYLLHFSTGPRNHSQKFLEHCEIFGQFFGWIFSKFFNTSAIFEQKI